MERIRARTPGIMSKTLLDRSIDLRLCRVRDLSERMRRSLGLMREFARLSVSIEFSVLEKDKSEISSEAAMKRERLRPMTCFIRLT